MKLKLKLRPFTHCFVSLPAVCISRALSEHRTSEGQRILIRIEHGELGFVLAWSGDCAGSSGSVEISSELAGCLGLEAEVDVDVSFVPPGSVERAGRVQVEPVEEGDWEVVALNMAFFESQLVNQVAVLAAGYTVPVWVNQSVCARIAVVDTVPSRMVQLVEGSEVIVVPRRGGGDSSAGERESGVVEGVRGARLSTGVVRIERHFDDAEGPVTRLFCRRGDVRRFGWQEGLLVAVLPIRPIRGDVAIFSGEGGGRRPVYLRVASHPEVRARHALIHAHAMATLGAHCFSRLRVRPERGFENWASRIPRSLYFQPVVFEEDEDLESDGSQLEVPALLRGFEAWIEANVMNGVKGASCSAKEVADELSVPVTNGLLFCLQGGSGYYRVYCDAMERIGAAEALPSESARRAGAVGDSLARSPFESLINLFGGPLDEKRGREGGGGGRANSVATERKRERPTEEWLDRVMEDTSVYFIPRNVRFDERSVVVGKKKQIRRNKELFLSYGIFPSSVLLPSLVLPRAVSCCPPPKIAEIGGLDREIERCKLHIVGALCCRRLKRRIGDSWSNCVIHIYGQRRSGKTTLSVSLAHQFALCPRYRAYPAVFSGLARCGISSDELRRELALFFEEAIAHQPSVVVFDDLDLLVSLKGEHEYAAAEDAVRAHVVSSEFAKWLRLIANARHIVCVIFTSLERFSLPRELCQPGLVSVECATPSQESRVQIFERLLARKKLTLAPSVDVSSLVSKCEGYTAADLEQYLDRALHAASVRVVDAASLGGRAVGAHNGTSNEVSNKTSNEVSNKTSNETPNEMSKTSNEMSNEMSKTSNEMSKTPNKTSSGCFLASDRQVCDSSFPRWNLALEDFDAARLGFAPASLRGLKLQESGVTWADVGGLDEICEEIRQLLEWPIKYQFLYRLVPISRCANVLLYGPSGCGKTLLAHAAAKECGLNFLSVKGPELLDKYIGQSEAGVRELFSRARNAAPCMLFFDEFDSIAPRRGHDQTGVTDRVVNQFLTELDGVESLEGVHVFAATSRPDLIDPALLRPGRLDKAYYVRPPAFSDRLAILSAVGRQLNFSDDVDFSVISSWTDGYTGADLRALLYDSQLLAIQERLDRQPAANSPQASLPLAHLLRVDVQGSDSPENQSHLLQRLETIKQKLEKRREISNFSLTNDRVNTFSETRARPTPITISMRHVKSAFSRLNPSTTPDQRKKNDLLYSSFSASKKMDASTDAQQLLLCQKVTMA